MLLSFFSFNLFLPLITPFHKKRDGQIPAFLAEKRQYLPVEGVD